MRVCHVVRQFRPGIGGLESVVWELASAQVAAGHAVRVVTLDRLFDALGERLPARETMNGINVVRIPFVGSRRYPIAWSVLREIGGADLVHVHGIDFFFDFLAFTAPLHRRTLIVSTHGGFFHTGFAARLKELYFATVTRLTLTRYAAVVAVSEADRRLFSRLRSHGLTLIENGVDIGKFADSGSRRPSKTLLAIGRFSSNKRLDRLIACLAALRRRDPEWRLKIVGRPWDLGSDDVRAIARAAGVAASVDVLASATDESIRAEMAECSIIISASEYEGFGLAAVEGMSGGLLPVLNDIPPFRQLVESSHTGIIADFSDPEATAAELAAWWQMIGRDYDRWRASAMRAASRYGWQRVAGDYETLYRAALGDHVRAILDIGVSVADLAEAVHSLDQCVTRRQPAHVTFANAHTLNSASSNLRVRDAMRRSVVLNDGIGVDIASRILFGKPFPANLNGTDFVPKYLQATRHRHRIFLLGAEPGVAEQAAQHFAQLAARHEIVGCRHGYIPARDTPRLIADIRASHADLLLVAMGNPAQELWLTEHLRDTGCSLGFGVGALFDFMAGRVPRAPAWMRALRLEWTYRLMCEPRRLWRRYLLGNSAFLIRVVAQWLGGSRVQESTNATTGT